MEDFLKIEKQQWYYTEASKIHGPVSLSELQSLLNTGSLSSDALVWQPDFTDWRYVRTIDALMSRSLVTPEDNWLYIHAGEESGPVSISRIRQFILDNTLVNGDKIRNVSHTNWIPIEDIIGDPEKTPPPLPTQSVPVSSRESKLNLPYANIGKRALAFLIDLAILVVLQNLLLLTGLHAQFSLLGLLYYPLLESSGWQATVGKKIIHLKVTNEDGFKIGLWRAVLRYFCKYLSAALLGFGFFLAAITEKKQGLHDMLAGTYVLAV